jgi:hypothetical protein
VTDDLAQVAAFETDSHQDAWRVRNMLRAAGIEAEVCPRSQWVLAPGGTGVLPEAPWYVLVLADDKAERPGTWPSAGGSALKSGPSRVYPTSSFARSTAMPALAP